jgi:hypothetical protein
MSSTARREEQPTRHREGASVDLHSLRVEAPKAASGFMLVQRLRSRCTLEGSEEAGWVVAGSADADLADALDTIRQWLHDEAIAQVTIHVGDHTHRMTRE